MNEASATGCEEIAVVSPVKQVAVIGIGSMGRPMARRILEAGFDLTVCDTKLANLEEFAALGARATVKPSDCAGCDAAIVLVATPEQLRSVALGRDGLRSGPTGGPRYLLVMSTVSPQHMRDLAEAFSGGSTRVVDAPVSGGVLSAQRGTLAIMAAGDEADIAVLRPLFETLGRSVFHCGALGAGQATKIVNNIIAISNLMISAEAYRIALHNGLSFDRLMPVLEASSARNFFSRGAADAPEAYGTWSHSMEGFEAFQSINRKDLDLALSASPSEMTLPAIAALRRLIDEAGAETCANWQAIGDHKPV